METKYNFSFKLWALVVLLCGGLSAVLLSCSMVSEQPKCKPFDQKYEHPTQAVMGSMLVDTLLRTKRSPSAKATTQTAAVPDSQPVKPPRPTWTPEFLQKLSIPPSKIRDMSAITLIYSGGVKSYFAPCGCQTDQLGGFGRLASLLKGYRHLGLTLLPVDAGNLFFELVEIEENKKIQSKVKAEMIAELYQRMGFRVMGVGPHDLVFGLDFFKQLSKRAQITALTSNLIDLKTQQSPFPTRHILQVGNLRFGFFALTDTPQTVAVGGSENLLLPNLDLLQQAHGSDATAKPEPEKVHCTKTEKDTKLKPKDFWQQRELQVLPALSAAQREVEALRRENADMIVLLSTLGTLRTEQIMSQVQGIDFAIEGEEENEIEPPRRINRGFLFSTLKEAQKIGVMTIYTHNKNANWAEVETPQERKKALVQMGEQIKSYRMQAQQMKAQGEDFAQIAMIYETQALQLEQDIATKKQSLSDPPSLLADHNGYFHLLMPLSGKVPELSSTIDRLDRYQKDVTEANLKAMDKVKPVAKTKTGDYYIGAEACRPCHIQQYDFWKTMRHAHAYNTLVKVGKQFDLDCIGCHVVGWMEPGGLYSLRDPQKLGDVQCENCHGPGGIHSTKDPTARTTRKESPSEVCTKCHYGTHDPKFNYEEKLKLVLGEGHGHTKLQEMLNKK